MIDSRQSYLQDVVVAGLRRSGYEAQAGRSVHFSYEMVALSPRCCADLGIALSEEDKQRPYVEVSGRKGLGVKADDLIDKLIDKALEEVASRHAGPPAEEQRDGGRADRDRRAALFPAEVHAQFGDRVRFSGSAELRRRDRAVRAVRGGARAQHSAEAGGKRRGAFPISARELQRGTLSGRQLQSEDFWQMLLAASKADSGGRARGRLRRAGARGEVRVPTGAGVQ